MNVVMASSVDEFDRPPNWFGGTKLSWPAKNVSRLATIRSKTLARHSRSVIRRYARGFV